MTGPEVRHLPEPDADTEPFWSGAARGRLLLQRCRTCDGMYHYPRGRCPTCWSSDVEWTDAAGTGTIWTYTIVRQNLAKPFRERVPYALAIVELVEGVRMLAVITGPPIDLAIGRRVRVSFLDEPEGVRVPVFELEGQL